MAELTVPQGWIDALRHVATEESKRIGAVRLVVLFGSVAQGRARPDSDADLAVLGGTFWEQLEIGSAIAAGLGRMPHVVDLERAPEALAYEIVRTGKVLFEKPDAWALFQARTALRFYDFRPARERCAEGVRRRLLAEVNTRG